MVEEESPLSVRIANIRLKLNQTRNQHDKIYEMNEKEIQKNREEGR